MFLVTSWGILVRGREEGGRWVLEARGGAGYREELSVILLSSSTPQSELCSGARCLGWLPPGEE